MSNPDFKQNFELSLAKLAEINSAIETNITGKQEFSGKIIKRLTEINSKIKELAGLITGLKQQLTSLQSQTETNNTQIGNTTTEITNLKNQIQQVTDEKTKAINELEQLKQQYATEIPEFQKKIDKYEEQIRDLTQQNLAIISERDTLKNELVSKGDLGENHANEIQNLSNQYNEQIKQRDEQLNLQQQDNDGKIKQLDEQLRLVQEDNGVKIKQRDEQLRLQKEDNDEKIKLLQDEIGKKDAELNQRIGDLGNNASQLQSQIEQLTKDSVDKQTRIEQLQGEITALQVENQDLIQRIITATQAIYESTNKLQELNNPASFNETELNAKFEELEDSIRQISSAIQGQPVANQNRVQKQVSKISGDTQISLLDISDNQQKKLTINEVQQEIMRKANQIPQPNKYSITLDELRKIINTGDIQGIQSIQSILDSNNITLKNSKIMGGKTKKNKKGRKLQKTKKIRKHKKQKGGFSYKQSSKRRSISTNSSVKGKGRTKRN